MNSAGINEVAQINYQIIQRLVHSYEIDKKDLAKNPEISEVMTQICLLNVALNETIANSKYQTSDTKVRHYETNIGRLSVIDGGKK